MVGAAFFLDSLMLSVPNKIPRPPVKLGGQTSFSTGPDHVSTEPYKKFKI